MAAAMKVLRQNWTSNRRRPCLLRAGVMVAVLFATAFRAGAAVVVWANVGSDFATGANWVGGTAPANNLTTDVASFGTAATFSPALATNRSVAGIVFASGAGAFTFTGTSSPTLTLGGSGISHQSANLQTIDSNLALALGAAASFTTTSTGALTIESDVANAGYLLTLSSTSTGAGVLAGIVSGTGGLTKTGGNTWTLSGANTYSGTTTLTAGTLIAGHDSAFGTGTLTLNGGTLAADSTRTLANTVTFGANSTIGGSAALTLAGGVTLTGNRTLTVSNSGGTTLSGVLGETGGAASFIKAGTGTLTLSGANTYTGNTTLSAGTLRATDASALGAGTLALTAGTLQLAANTNTDFANNVTLGGNVTIAVDRTSAGAGVTHSLGQLTTGSYTVSVQPGANLTAGSDYGLTFDDVNLVGNPLTLNVANHGAGTGTVTLGSLSNIATRGLTKAGDGVVVLGATSGTITSGTAFIINAGTLRLGAADAMGASALANLTVNDTAGGTATFGLDGNNQTILALTFGGTGATASSVNNLSTGTGLLTLGGPVTYTSTNNPLGTTISGLVDLGAATRTFTIGDSSSTAAEVTISAVLSGAAVGVTKAGTGTLVLEGANTYSGTTTLSGGTLRAAASAAALGAGNLSLGAGALELAGDSGLNFDRNTTFTGNAAIKSDRVTSGTGVSHTLGTLTTGTFTHTISAGGNVSSGTAGIAFGATTLTGNPTFLVGPGAELSLGALTDGGVARALTKSDAGTLAFNAAAGSWATAGDSLTINGGTARLDASHAFGTGTNTALTVRDTLGSTATFDLNGFNQSIGNVTLGGTGGTATSINTLASGAGTLTLSGSFTSTATGNPTGTWTVSGNLALAAGTRTFSIADSTGISGTTPEVAITAAISGPGNLAKATGTGTLTLSGTNTFTGSTTVSAGILRATNATALGAGALILGGGTLDLVGDSGTAFGRNTTLSGATTIRVDTATANPGVTHTLGTLAAAATTLTVQAGPTVNANTDYGLTFGATTLTGNTTLSVANNGSGTGTVTVGSLSNSAVRGLTKAGTGTLLLGAASGTITSGSDFAVTGGTMRLGASGALGASALADLTVRDTLGGTALLDLNGFNQSALTLTFGGTGGTTTSVNQVATGAGTLTLGGTVTFTATGNPLGATLSGNVNLGTAPRTFSIADSTSTAAELTVSANLSGTGGGIAKTGAGTLVLAGTNTQTGATTISGGTLTVDSGATLSAATAGLTVNTGTLNLNHAAQAIGAFSGTAGTVNLAPGHALTATQTTTTTFGGTLTGTDATFTKAGTGILTLSGANTYSGATTIAAGTLSVNTIASVGGGASALGAPTTIAAGTIHLGSGTSAGALTFTGTSATSDRVFNLAGTTGGATLTTNGDLTLTSAFTATGAGSKSLTLDGTATGSALSGALVDPTGAGQTSLIKTGAGTWTLSGANPYSGPTSILRGTLSVGSLNRVTGGSASSHLGAPTTVANGTIHLGGTTFTGTLLYTGAGQTTDRVINLAGTTGGGEINSSGSGGLTFTSGLTATGAGSKTLTLRGTSTGNTFAGAIVNNSGTNLTALTKSDSGTWTLTGSNTYTGATTVNDGTLILNSAATAVRGALALGNGTTSPTVQLLAAQQIASTAPVTFNNTGGAPVLDLNGFSQTVGSIATTNPAAALALGNPGGATTFTTGNTTSTTFSGLITGGANAAFVKAGTGTLTLAGANTFAGNLTVSAGVLSAQHPTALGTTAGTTAIANGAALQLSNVAHGNLTLGAEALSLQGTGITSTGALRNIAGNNSFAGAVTLAAASRINSDADTLTLSGGVSSANLALTVGGAGNLNLSGSLNLGSGSLTKQGTGTLTLAGSSHTVGSLTLSGGTVAVDAGSTLTSAAISAAAGTTLSIASGGMVTANFASGSTTFSGALAGAGEFQKTGAGTLVFNQSFSAPSLTLNFGGGTLSLAGGSGFTFGTINITGNTILDFNNSAGTFLSSANVDIADGVVVTVRNWISVADNAAASTAWYVTSTLNGAGLGGTDQIGGPGLDRIVFESYTGLTSTWVSGSHDGWFNREVRPTPEPATYGALLLGASAALVLRQRRRDRRRRHWGRPTARIFRGGS